MTNEEEKARNDRGAETTNPETHAETRNRLSRIKGSERGISQLGEPQTKALPTILATVTGLIILAAIETLYCWVWALAVDPLQPEEDFSNKVLFIFCTMALVIIGGLTPVLILGPIFELLDRLFTRNR